MGMKKPDVHNRFALRRTMELWDDFKYYVSTDLWTTTKDTSPTAAVSDGVGGILTLTGDTTANDEVYVASTVQCFKFVADNPIIVEAMLQFSEQNTNQAAMMFGLMSSVGADSIVDTTGEPKSSFSGAVIYKVPGGTQWKTCSSLGSTQTKNQSTTNAPDTAYHRLTINVMPVSSSIAEVTYYVDGVQLGTSGGRPGQNLIKDQLTYTSAAVMGVFVGLKQIATGVAEVLNVDYLAGEQLVRPFVPNI